MGAEIVAIAPDDARAVLSFGERTPIPFPCLADPDREVFDRYDVGRSALSFGQRPAVFAIGPEGTILQAWRGRQAWEIPANDEVLGALRQEQERS